MQIVLARTEDDFEVVSTAGIDLGRAPQMRKVKRAVAMMWLSKGAKASDIPKAEVFAKQEGYQVFVFEKERDPLGKAKRALLEADANA